MLKFQFRKKERHFILGILLCCSMLLSGCGGKSLSVMDTQLKSAQDNQQSDFGKTYQLEPVSKDICVIPTEQSTTATDEAISAKAALLINETENTLIFAKNVYTKQYPASVSKIVTALLALEEGHLEDMVTVSREAAGITEPGAKLCGFQEGDKISMEDLLYCLLVYSGNDAAIAIAEHISGSVDSFAEQMNRRMAELGVFKTHFTNPHGLHEKKHYTTAYDLYLVFHELLKYKEFRQIIQTTSYTAKWTDGAGEEHTLSMTSSEAFLNGSATVPDGIQVEGGKSGTTINAGSCMILLTQDEEEKEYISVILKAPSSTEACTQMSHLLGYIQADSVEGNDS